MKALKDDLPIITAGSIELPKDAEDAINYGASFAALGRELIREPKWVQKVLSNDEESIRVKLSPGDMDDLAIPGGTQPYLIEFFSEVMNFTTSSKGNINLSDRMAPMEGYQQNKYE